MAQTADGTDLLILGGGSVTTEYYLPALRQLRRLQGTVVVEPDASTRAAIAAQFPEVRILKGGYQEALANVDAQGASQRASVVVALPNTLHVDATREVLSTGYGVLCEKPLSLKATDCTELVKCATAHGAVLKVAMSRRYLPSFMMAKDIVDRKELGQIKSVAVRDCSPFQWRPRSLSFFSPQSGGILADMGVHYLDFIDTLIGPMTPLSYTDDMRGGCEASCDYRLTNGSVGVSLVLSRVGYSGTYVQIECERGEVRIEKSNETDVFVTPHGRPTRRLSLSQPFECPTWPTGFPGSFCQMLSDFRQAATASVPRLADGVDAARAAGLIQWAYESRISAERTPAIAFAAGCERQQVLVTGGTGFIGGHLVDRLTTDAGEQLNVRAAVRTPASCANLARYPVHMTPLDLLDPVQVKQSVAGTQTVYHLAYGKDGDNAPQITIEGTKNIVRSAIAANVECVVVISTMYVFGFPETEEQIDETFPYRPYGGEYADSKATMERWCLEQARTSGRTRIVVLNPTCVFGPGGNAYTALPAELAQRGHFCWIEDGSGAANYTYVENTVDAIIAAAITPEAHGHRFIINDGTTTWRNLIGPLLGPLSSGPASLTHEEFLRLPRPNPSFVWNDLLRAAMASTELRAVATRSALVRRVAQFARRRGYSIKPPYPTVQLHSENRHASPPKWLETLYPPNKSKFSAEKAHRVLKWTPRVGLQKAQERSVKWLIATGRIPD